MAEKITFNLSVSIIDNTGNEIKSLEVREPTSEDAINLNYPFVINGDDEPVFNARKVYAWLSALTNQPPSICKKISLKDVEKFKYFLVGFFLAGKEQAIQLLK